MNKSQTRPFPPLFPHLASFLNGATACFMTVCVVYVVIQIGERFFPGWNGLYLLLASLVLAFEAMLTKRAITIYFFQIYEWLPARLSEWVVILILLKLLLYIVRGPAQLLIDLRMWSNDFLSFFTEEYFLVCFIALFVWSLSSNFAGYLLELEEDPQEIALEKDGVALKDRHQIRRSFITTFFGVGIALLLITSILRVQIPGLPIISPVNAAFPMLLYFISGFILLAQTQFWLKGVHWHLQDIPTSQKVGLRWFWTSFGILLMVLVMIIFLPTSYTLGFLELLQKIIAALFFILTFILGNIYNLIMAPFIFFMSYLSKLLGSPADTTIPTAPRVPPTIAPPEAVDPDIYFEIIRSFVFWSIFVFGVYFAFRYYLRQNKEVADYLAGLPFVQWLQQVKTWFLKLTHQFSQAVSKNFKSNIKRLSQIPAAFPKNIQPGLVLPQNLSPRQMIIKSYLALLEWNQQAGLPRKPSQTPNEYSDSLVTRLKDAEKYLSPITQAFEEAHYTDHPISKTLSQDAQKNISALESLIKQNQEKPD
jgi:hypothetical protein